MQNPHENLATQTQEELEKLYTTHGSHIIHEDGSVTFLYRAHGTAANQKVELSCPDLHEWMLNADGEELNQFKQQGNMYYLHTDPIPPNIFATYSIKVDNTPIPPGPKQDTFGIAHLKLIDEKKPISITQKQTAYIKRGATKIPELFNDALPLELKGSVEHSVYNSFYKSKPDDVFSRFTKRDTWIYTPKAYETVPIERRKIIFMLDGKDFCEKLTPYIDMQEDIFANTAIVFIDPDKYQTLITCNLHFMSNHPSDYNSYKGQYLFINDHELIYVKPDDGIPEKVTINDFDQLQTQLNTMRLDNNSNPIRLSGLQVREFISLNGGHTPAAPPVRVCEDFYQTDDLTNMMGKELIPHYCAKLGIQNKNQVIVAAHSLAAYPMIGIVEKYPNQIGGLFLFSPALNQKRELTLPTNPDLRLKNVSIFTQIGEMENKIPPQVHQDNQDNQDMQNKSRLEATKEFHDSFIDHDNEVLHIHSFGHDSIHVFEGLIAGTKFHQIQLNTLKANLSTNTEKTDHFKGKIKELKQSGHLAPTESSKAKEREKFILPVEPKNSWRP